jgi:hypothetical protein
LYLAIPGFGDVDLRQIKEGNVGSTSTLLQNFNQVPVSVETTGPQLAAQFRETLLKNSESIVEIGKDEQTRLRGSDFRNNARYYRIR